MAFLILPWSNIFISVLKTCWFNLSFKNVVPFAIALDDIALAKIDRKVFDILLSNIRLIFSLFIFFGFNFLTACSAAIDPSCLGFKISL